MATVFVVAVFAQILDGTMVNVAIPTIADDFGIDAVDADRAIVGYFVALAIVIPISGALSARIGQRRLFVGALIGFLVSSVLSGSSQSFDQFTVARIVQGAFAGAITPIGAAMLYEVYPPEDRARISAVIGAVILVSPALGPGIGGALVEWLDWRWVFFVTLPFVAAAATLTQLWIKPAAPDRSARIDLAGFVLTATSIGPALFAISIGPSSGWDSPAVVAAVGVSAISVIVLLAVERRHPHPVLALGLYRDRLFRGANLVSFPAFSGFFAVVFVLPLFLQQVAGRGAAETGLIMAFQPLGTMLSMQLVGRRLYNRYGPRPLMLIGAGVCGVATLLLATISASTGAWFIAAALLLRGGAVGFIFIPVQTSAFSTIARRDLPHASSLFNAQRQVAVAVGVAVAATVVASLVGSLDGLDAAPELENEAVLAFRVSLAVSAAWFAAALVAALRLDNEAALEAISPDRGPASAGA